MQFQNLCSFKLYLLCTILFSLIFKNLNIKLNLILYVYFRVYPVNRENLIQVAILEFLNLLALLV